MVHSLSIMKASYLEDAATKVGRCHTRIEATRDELLRLQINTTAIGAPADLTKRSAVAARLDFTAAARADELRAAALQLAEEALTAASAVRKLLDGAGPPTWQTRREAWLYVRRLGKLAALCERTSREAVEAARAVAADQSASRQGKHRKLNEAADLEGGG